MENKNGDSNFHLAIDVHLDIFDFFNRAQLLRMILVNRHFNRLVEEHYPKKPFIYSELKFLRHFGPLNNDNTGTKSRPNSRHYYIPSYDELKKMPRTEYYFGGIYMFHLTALNCCCEQNVNKLLGEPMFCHRILKLNNDLSETTTKTRDNAADLKEARSYSLAANLHKNCANWTKMDTAEVKDNLQIYWSGRWSRRENEIYWKHQVHDEPTKNVLLYEFFRAHRTSNPTCLRYEGDGLKRICPGLELLTNDFALIQQHLKHPFLQIMKLDLSRIMHYPNMEIISECTFSTNIDFWKREERNYNFYRQKFANELRWLLIEQNRIHAAARINLDIKLLLTLLEATDGRKNDAVNIRSNDGDLFCSSSAAANDYAADIASKNSLDIVEALGLCAELHLGFGNLIGEMDQNIIFNPKLAKLLHAPLYIYIYYGAHKTETISKLLGHYNPKHVPHRLLSFGPHGETESDLLPTLIKDFQNATSPCTYFTYFCANLMEDHDHEYKFYNKLTNEFLFISPPIRYSIFHDDKDGCFVTRGDCSDENIKANGLKFHSMMREDVATRMRNFSAKFPHVPLKHIAQPIHDDHKLWQCFASQYKEEEGKKLYTSIGPFLRHIFVDAADQLPGEMHYNNIIIDFDSQKIPI